MQQSLDTNCSMNAASNVPARIGFDPLDLLPLFSLPEALTAGAEEPMLAAVSAMVAEGASGPAARRLACREIALQRLGLRIREAAINAELTRVMQGSPDLATLECLERLIKGQHERLQAAIERFSRLGQAPQPKIRITAHSQATQINLGASQ
jgi:hypothetical protein